MIRYLWAGLLICSLAPSTLWASSAGSTEGLWHAFEKESGKTIFYLVVSGSKAEVYNPGWGRLDLEVDADRIEFRLPMGIDGIRIQGGFEEGRLHGEWHRPHPQYRIDGAWYAERIVASSDYDPWEYLRSDSEDPEPLDLASLVAEKKPTFEDAESFEEFWNEEVEAHYYPLLTVGLYSDSTGEFRSKIREERLSKIYQYLRDRSKHFQETMTGLPRHLQEVQADLSDKFSWVATFRRPVFLLSGGDFDFSVATLSVDGEPRSYLLLGADWLERETNEDQRRYTLARSWLYQMIAVSQPRLGAEIARRGITAWVAERLEYSKDPQDLLSLSQKQWNQLKERLPELCLRLRSVYFAPAGEHLETYFLKGSRIGTVIGYEFAVAMSEGLTPEQMFSLGSHELEERFQAFMNLKAAEAQPASQEE